MTKMRFAEFVSKDGQEIILTGPEHAGLSDADLMDEAIREAHKQDLIGPEWPRIAEAELVNRLHIIQEEE